MIHENLYSNGISHSHILIKSLREKYHQLVARACAHAQACMNEIHKQKIKTRQESGGSASASRTRATQYLRTRERPHTGKAYYGCSVGVVITNFHFTPKEIANKTHTVLWDGEQLQKLMEHAAKANYP